MNLLNSTLNSYSVFVVGDLGSKQLCHWKGLQEICFLLVLFNLFCLSHHNSRLSGAVIVSKPLEVRP